MTAQRLYAAVLLSLAIAGVVSAALLSALGLPGVYGLYVFASAPVVAIMATLPLIMRERVSIVPFAVAVVLVIIISALGLIKIGH
ncbi:hypothetical protein [Pyrobaculum sp.]|uniref:hypothetical protein n=1 Tax=Pyrobaculum sp. TaxID=2004705 RepID=UPI00315EB406